MAGSSKRGGNGRRKPRSAPKPGEKPPAAKPIKPPAAKPVKPPAAKPVKPPTAKPVKPQAAKPIKPPAARPVKPAAAKPVKPPAAQPVKPTAGTSAKPPAAKPAKSAAAAATKSEPAAGASATRKSTTREEVVGARGRQSTARGMSVAAKAGLITALVTLLVTALTVYLLRGGGGKGSTSAELNAYGALAAASLGGGDTNWWLGTGPKKVKHDTEWFKKTFIAMLGEPAGEFWEKRVKELSATVDRELFTQQEIEKLQREKRQMDEVMEKLDAAAGAGGAKKTTVKSRLNAVYRRIPKDEKGRFRVLAAWIREGASGGKEGAWLAGSRAQSSIRYDYSTFQATGSSGNGRMDGIIDESNGEYRVKVFTSDIGTPGRTKDRLTGYVAVWERGGTSSGTGLGMLMIVLAPLLTGLTAYSIANGHSKNIRALAREIDRLGSSGDPSRMLRAEGQEASTLARAIERMAGNIEFRAKHEGADLDEIVSREQKVAEEIHGALMSKNPPRLDNYEVETLFKPGFEIGGDHFEYFRIDEDHLGIILLDTNVRGVTAALVMSATRAYVRMMAPGVLSPAEVLRRVNEALAGDLPSGRHVTALYVVLNTAEGSATIASAGHLPLLVYRHNTGKVAKVNPEGLALGLDTGPVFDRALQEGDIPVGVGDRIVLYTDGALKIQNAEGEEFGERRFYQSVLKEAPKNSQAFVNFVGSAIDQYHLDVQQNDDITISTVKRLR